MSLFDNNIYIVLKLAVFNGQVWCSNHSSLINKFLNWTENSLDNQKRMISFPQSTQLRPSDFCFKCSTLVVTVVRGRVKLASNVTLFVGRDSLSAQLFLFLFTFQPDYECQFYIARQQYQLLRSCKIVLFKAWHAQFYQFLPCINKTIINSRCSVQDVPLIPQTAHLT